MIGFSEMFLLLLVVLVVVLVSRLQTKRICPRCGFAIRSYTRQCPECGLVFPRKDPNQRRT